MWIGEWALYPPSCVVRETHPSHAVLGRRIPPTFYKTTIFTLYRTRKSNTSRARNARSK